MQPGSPERPDRLGRVLGHLATLALIAGVAWALAGGGIR